jgi:hypothetical protein
MDLEDTALTPVKPGNQDDLLPYPQTIQGVGKFFPDINADR